ncbi:MAG: Plug domain-containing protein, partial [Caldimonas sp.]
MGGHRRASRGLGHGRRAAAWLVLGAVGFFASVAATAQNAGADGAPAPTPVPDRAAVPAPARADQLAPVEITGIRPDDVQERRQSTAAKIIIGRDEIDRFGDSTLGDVLKRLPGVTIQGRPGRGGAIRLRGLGNGYTQILL